MDFSTCSRRLCCFALRWALVNPCSPRYRIYPEELPQIYRPTCGCRLCSAMPRHASTCVHASLNKQARGVQLGLRPKDWSEMIVTRFTRCQGDDEGVRRCLHLGASRTPISLSPRIRKHPGWLKLWCKPGLKQVFVKQVSEALGCMHPGRSSAAGHE